MTEIKSRPLRSGDRLIQLLQLSNDAADLFDALPRYAELQARAELVHSVEALQNTPHMIGLPKIDVVSLEIQRLAEKMAILLLNTPRLAQTAVWALFRKAIRERQEMDEFVAR